MTTARSLFWFPLFLVVTAASACESSDSDTPGSAGSNSQSGSGGTAGSGGGAAGSGTAGQGGGRAGSNGSAGSSGKAGSAGSSPTGGGAGSAGSAGPGAAGASGEGGSAGVGDAGAGAGGAPDQAQEYLYIATILGGVHAYSLDEKGRASELAGSPVTKGPWFYAASVDPTQTFLYTAEYNAHRFSAYAIAADGTLPATPTTNDVFAGSPGTLALHPSGKFAYLGSREEDAAIHVYAIEPATAKLTRVGEPLAVHGAPNYLAADPSGHFVYASQSAEAGIRGYRVNQTTGALTELGASPFGVDKVFGGALVFKPGGGFLYASRNGLNAFSVNAESGVLELVAGSPFTQDLSSDSTASNITVDPQGKYLYVSEFLVTRHVTGFAIAADGKLTQVPGPVIVAPSPYSVAVEPSGRFLVAGNDTGSFSVYSLNRGNGSLKEVEGSPFPLDGLQPEMAFAIAR